MMNDGMTDAQAALAQVREALAAVPTPGPWYVRTNRHPTTDGRPWGWLDAAPPGGPQRAIAGVRVEWEGGDTSAVNARYLAACSPANIAAILAHVDAQAAEIERLRAERDEHARWREKLADDLHERESQISDGWAALRASGVQSEESIADGITFLRFMNLALAADKEALREAVRKERILREEFLGRMNLGRGQLMALAAVRYCLGRSSYIVGDCADWLITIWSELSADTRALIRRDIEDAFDQDDLARSAALHYKPLGDDCDRRQWERVRALWDERNIAIDAAMGLTRPAEES